MEPPKKLAEALTEKSIGEKVFEVVNIGESREYESAKQ
jgi:hypothetical protein